MKVNIIIGGGQKCGTTALHFYLSQHPQVLASFKKELDFFSYDENFQKGIAYYHSFFKPSLFRRLTGREKFYMEASPSYLFDEDPATTANRIFDYNPDCKLIFSIRNPVDRAFSAYQMYKHAASTEAGRNSWMSWVSERNPELAEQAVKRTVAEFESFDAFVKSELEASNQGQVIEFNVLNTGHYIKGLDAYHKYFNPLVIAQEKMDRHLEDTMDVVTGYTGLKKFNWADFTDRKVFKGVYKKNILPETRALLNDHYRTSNTKLFEMTGVNYIDQ